MNPGLRGQSPVNVNDLMAIVPQILQSGPKWWDNQTVIPVPCATASLANKNTYDSGLAINILRTDS